MKKLNELKWKAFDIHHVFPEIQRGKRLKTDDHILGNMAYVSSSAMNNGVDNFVSNSNGVRIFGNCLTLANSGSVGTSFYHPYRFVASDHVTKMQNLSFNKYVYLFIATISNRLSEKYSFNREINDRRLSREKIMLPANNNGEPDYIYMEAYMKEVEKRLLTRYMTFLENKITQTSTVGKLLKINWKAFFIEDIFEIKSGVRLTNSDKISGLRPFVGATDSNNGITSFVGNSNNSLDSNVLGVNYNGSVVENFYHPYEALFSDDVKRLHLKNAQGNIYIYLFLKNIILNQKVKYEYGYKFNGERMRRQKIMLPIDENGNPDYSYMERFMMKKEASILNRYISSRLTEK